MSYHFLGAGFLILSLIAGSFLNGAPWYLFSSLLRAVFGVGILIAANRLYGGTAKEILSFCKSKTAILSGISFLAYLLYYIITVCAGCERIIGVPENLLFAGIVLQQITTGFYEELNYRFMILEGYFYGAETVRNRRLYAMISSFVFGLAHVATGWNATAFFLPGTIGFAFAVIYLKSRNLVVPMLLHFVYNIVANVTLYIEWNHSALFLSMNSGIEIALGMMGIISLVILMQNKARSVAGKTDFQR